MQYQQSFAKPILSSQVFTSKNWYDWIAWWQNSSSKCHGKSRQITVLSRVQYLYTSHTTGWIHEWASVLDKVSHCVSRFQNASLRSFVFIMEIFWRINMGIELTLQTSSFVPINLIILFCFIVVFQLELGQPKKVNYCIVVYQAGDNPVPKGQYDPVYWRIFASRCLYFCLYVDLVIHMCVRELGRRPVVYP